MLDIVKQNFLGVIVRKNSQAVCSFFMIPKIEYKQGKNHSLDLLCGSIWIHHHLALTSCQWIFILALFE